MYGHYQIYCLGGAFDALTQNTTTCLMKIVYNLLQDSSYIPLIMYVDTSTVNSVEQTTSRNSLTSADIIAGICTTIEKHLLKK